jgi:hypothetical protein
VAARNRFYGHIVVRGNPLERSHFCSQGLQTRLFAQEADCDREKAEHGKKPHLVVNNAKAQIMR